MLSQLLEKAGLSRAHLFWGLLSLLVVGQLIAFWMLCSQQVHKAAVRDATLHVQRVAISDCLRYVPGATLDSCAEGLGSGGRPAGVVATRANAADTYRNGQAIVNTATSLSVAFR